MTGAAMTGSPPLGATAPEVAPQGDNLLEDHPGEVG